MMVIEAPYGDTSGKSNDDHGNKKRTILQQIRHYRSFKPIYGLFLLAIVIYCYPVDVLSVFRKQDEGFIRSSKGQASIPNSNDNNNRNKPQMSLQLNRKPGTRVILNLGSNVDPIVPKRSDGACALAVAFEPVVGDKIRPHPALFVVTAAVVGQQPSSLSAMHLYNRDGLSSSLNVPSYKAGWNQFGQSGGIRIVPTISFASVLEAFGLYQIDFIKTDMQSFDFEAVSSVGADLATKYNVTRLMTEVYINNVVTYKAEFGNDLCRDWWPHMTRIGYQFEGLYASSRGRPKPGYANEEELKETCQKQLQGKGDDKKTPGLAEADAYWRLKTSPALTDPNAIREAYLYPTHNRNPERSTFEFTEAEYAACTSGQEQS